jgi:hypothetical protein
MAYKPQTRAGHTLWHATPEGSHDEFEVGCFSLGSDPRCGFNNHHLLSAVSKKRGKKLKVRDVPEGLDTALADRRRIGAARHQIVSPDQRVEREQQEIARHDDHEPRLLLGTSSLLAGFLGKLLSPLCLDNSGRRNVNALNRIAGPVLSYSQTDVKQKTADSRQ